MMESCDEADQLEPDTNQDDDEELDDVEEVEHDLDARAYGIFQQLPVDGQDPDFDSGSPQTAEEYLRRVRWARNCLGITCSHPNHRKLT